MARSVTYYEKLEAAGHVLKREEDGSIDNFVLCSDYHNGPGCVNCDESWCEHCEDNFTQCAGREATDAAYRESRYRQYLKLKEEFE